MNLIRYLRRVDSTLFLTVISLGIICLMIIGSATHANVYGYPERYDFILKQGIFLVLGIIISGFTLKYDYRILYKWAPTLFVINALSLIVVKFAGTSALGAQRWIQIGPFTLQPSEFAKLFMIICLARLLSNRKQEYKTWRSLLPVAGLMTLPTFLIFIQPDLGTSLVFCAITLGMLYICGLSIKLVKQALIGLLVISPIVWFFVLHEYQKMRLLILFNPNVDPYGSGYHVIQSKISIGSGGFIGQGLFSGTQSQLDFLPENHTDFIFSVIGEELGFTGGCITIFLLFLIVLECIIVAVRAKNFEGRLICCGVAIYIGFQTFINIGVVSWILPNTGVPLPFFSCGLTSLLTLFTAMGIVLNVSLQRNVERDDDMFADDFRG